jgi:hypothetical protein
MTNDALVAIADTAAALITVTSMFFKIGCNLSPFTPLKADKPKLPLL